VPPSASLKRAARPLVRTAGEPFAAVAERALRATGLRAGVAVAYHSLAERTGDPATELVPPHAVSLYAAQLRHLADRYAVVPAAALPDAVRTRRRGERFPVAITFDDDLASHAAAALPVLTRLELTATFFVSGASLEAPFSFWWERLQRAVGAGAPVADPSGSVAVVEPTSIRVIGRAVEALPAQERERWAEELAVAAGPDPPDAGMRAAEVGALAEAGMTIGFHTERHHPLTTLDDEELAAALARGRPRLEELVGAPVDVVGYPHGRADARVADAARNAGFRVGYTTAERAVTPGDDLLLLGRINPSYRSVGHFALQLVLALAAAHR
jgi:peptidoglycan/xylan/chitin deacetylase (PgdA/CDA1 family)